MSAPEWRGFHNGSAHIAARTLANGDFLVNLTAGHVTFAITVPPRQILHLFGHIDPKLIFAGPAQSHQPIPAEAPSTTSSSLCGDGWGEPSGRGADNGPRPASAAPRTAPGAAGVGAMGTNPSTSKAGPAVAGCERLRFPRASSGRNET